MNRKKNINPAEVGARIKLIRADKTLEEFAVDLGVKNPTVYRYETDRIPDAETLLHIAEIGGTSVDWLLTGSTRPLRVNEDGDIYGKDRELLNVIRDVKNVWTHGDSTVRDIFRSHLRALKKLLGLI